MKRKLLTTIVLIIPMLMIILVYGVVVRNELFWSVIVIIGALSVVGLFIIMSSYFASAQQTSVAFTRMQLSGIAGAFIALLGLAFYDQVTSGVLQWEKYVALFSGPVLFLILLMILSRLKARKR